MHQEYARSLDERLLHSNNSAVHTNSQRHVNYTLFLVVRLLLDIRRVRRTLQPRPQQRVLNVQLFKFVDGARFHNRSPWALNLSAHLVGGCLFPLPPPNFSPTLIRSLSQTLLDELQVDQPKTKKGRIVQCCVYWQDSFQSCRSTLGCGTAKRRITLRIFRLKLPCLGFPALPCSLSVAVGSNLG
jgi:hypothetical protein